MQRTNHARGLINRIQAVGLFERLLIERDDRIDIRASLVERGDAIEIALDELARREPAGFECGVDVVDRRLHDLKRRHILALLCMADR